MRPKLTRNTFIVGIGLAVITAVSGIAGWLRNESSHPTVGRVVFGGIPDALIFTFYFVIVTTLLVTTVLFIQRFNNVARGSDENRRGHRKQRRQALIRALMMRTVSEDRAAGIIHGLIYWSFLVLTLVTVTLEIDHLMPTSLQFLHSTMYEIYALIGDLAGIGLLAGVLGAAYRRYVVRTPRLAKRTEPEDAWILCLLGLLAISGFVVEAARIATVGRPSFEQWSIVGYQLAPLFDANATTWHQQLWVGHVGLFVALLITLPVTKLRHAVTSPTNAYLSVRDRPNGAAREVPSLLEADVDTVGASAISSFTWKQLLDTEACTTCGRCTSVCPANQTGKVLDPREIVLKVGAVMASSSATPMSPTLGPPLELPTDAVTDVITAEEVFACTTCKACDEICPVEIEIMDKIVDIRRHYTLMESEFPNELGNAFVALENSENPWGMPASARLDWAAGLDVPVADPTQPFSHEYLYWVGCAGSFDDRAKETTKAVAKILSAANIDFAVLGPSERCTGDPARRAGNEYLFQMLATQNIAMLNGTGVQKIITNCPHCFNTLSNEYKDFGGNYEVLHHTQLLSELLRDNRIPLRNDGESKSIVYHDSCYLGRYNNEYDAPRNVVGSLAGIAVVEAGNNRDGAFCCGAGGANMWMEETGQRINIRRSQELLDTQADEIAVACPFCAVMIGDGVAANNAEVPVKDVAMILADRLA